MIVAMVSPPFIGIDFGTCNSSMAWFNPQIAQAELLLNAEGEDKTPSVVYFGPSEVLVGRHAEAGLESREARKRILRAVKRELARPRAWMFDSRRVTPIEVAAEILKKLKRDAEEGQFHEPVVRAVITCPATFDETQKDKLREAAALAGFEEVELLPEPVAAAVACAQAEVQVGRYVLVYDLGGGTFDLALLVREDGDDAYRLGMEPRGELIGGEDFDQALYDYFDGLMQEKFNCTVSGGGVDLNFLRQCRQCKESLSASEKTYPFSWWLPDHGSRFELKVSRAKFEALIERHVERTVALTHGVREDAAAAGFELETVIMIGGSSRIPLIKRRLHEALHVEPREWQKKDVAVALGAAYYAQSRWGQKVAPSAPPAPTSPKEPAESRGPDQEPSQQGRDLLARAQAAFDKAVQPIDKASGKQPSGPELLEEALRCAQAACDQEPRWDEAAFLKGRILQTKEEWSLASAAFTAAIRLEPEAAPAYRQRGQCRLKSGDNAGARTDFDEAIKREPLAVDYRDRAVAFCRLGNAAAAVIDLQTALARSEPDEPPAALAALNTISALLLRDELARPADAIAVFGEALRSLASAQERGLPLFDPLCALFGVSERLKVDPTGGAHFSLGRELLRHGLLAFRANRPADDPSLPIIAAVQRALWQACKSVHGGCTRESAAELVANSTPEIDSAIWMGDPDLGFYLASINAEQNDPAGTILWLGRLLKVKPAFDIRLAHQDPAIAKLGDPKLREFLTPQLIGQEQHGAVFNHVTVTNRSPFRVTDVTVTVSVQRKDGSKDAPIIQHLASLDAGASHRWAKLFQDVRLFGSNIHKVDLTLDCAEAQLTRPGPRPQPPPLTAVEEDHAFDLEEGPVVDDIEIVEEGPPSP
jgi:tetratricopeptide (TPR) repeat protein